MNLESSSVVPFTLSIKTLMDGSLSNIAILLPRLWRESERAYLLDEQEEKQLQVTEYRSFHL
jgi:hypothetical protein